MNAAATVAPIADATNRTLDSIQGPLVFVHRVCFPDGHALHHLQTNAKFVRRHSELIRKCHRVDLCL